LANTQLDPDEINDLLLIASQGEGRAQWSSLGDKTRVDWWVEGKGTYTGRGHTREENSREVKGHRMEENTGQDKSCSCELS
jgi:hypothetical protein